MANRTTQLNTQRDFCTQTHGCRTDDEVIARLKRSPVLYSSYQGLNEEWKRHFLDFCQAKKTLPLTYDPFFKRIFHPDIHPNRLSRFVSSILGMTVKVIRILPSEDSVLGGDTLLIMDLLGELEDGSLINIEIQKQGYAFPAERISCYSSDLVMRQYARVKGERGSTFTYRDIKNVYVIVIFEKSAGEFHKTGDAYIHHGKVGFDTGLDMKFIQEYFLVALDVYRKIPYPKRRSEQTAWLSLLTVDSPEEGQKLAFEYPEYPWIEEILEEIAMLREKPEEVLGMYSEALRILDRNTIKYMIEELEKELEETKEKIEAAEAEAKAAKAEAKQVEVKVKEAEVRTKEAEAKVEEKRAVLEAKDAEIAELKRQLAHYRNK